VVRVKENKMLTRLLPEQVSRLWPIIKYAIAQSVPPISGEHPDKLNRILSSALCGKIDVWASYIKGEVNKFEGIAVTEVVYDDVTGIKNLMIYSIYSYIDEEKVKGSSYVSGLVSFAKYAKSLKCSNVIAYTQKSGIVALAKRLGGDTSFTLISFDIDKIVKKLNELS